MKNTNNSLPDLWRDDDCNVYTNITEFKKLHQKFIDAKKVHTVAVIMKDLWNNHALFYYLATAPYLEIGLHGWEHNDYSEMSYQDCYMDLKNSITYWEGNYKRMMGVDMVPYHKATRVFFAPWNKDSRHIRSACEALGLEFCSVRKGEWNGQNIRSFHHWSVNDNFKP